MSAPSSKPTAVVNLTELGLIRYYNMCTAIAECHRVDEAKDIRDKMVAIEAYAKQAKNFDAERQACQIQFCRAPSRGIAP